MGRRQQEKSEQTRQELQTAAMRLFAEQGYERTTILAITRAAGYAKGSFYRHWESKEVLFLALMEERLQRHWRELDAALVGVESMSELVQTALLTMERAMAEDQWAPLMVEFQAQAARHPVARNHVAELYRRWSLHLAQRLRQVRGVPMPTFAAATGASLLMALFDGYTLQQMAGAGTLSREAVAHAVTLLLTHTRRREVR